MRCPRDDWDHDRDPSSNYAGSSGPAWVGSPCRYEPYHEYSTDPQYGNDGYDGTNRPDTIAVRGCFNRWGARIRLSDIKDRATGVRYLFVNGVLAIDDGEYYGSPGGEGFAAQY